MKTRSVSTKLFTIAAVIVLLAVMAPLSSVNAAGTIYVRPDGDDTNCDGTANVAYPGSGGPGLACAVKTIQKGVDLVDTGGNVMVWSGSYSEQVTITRSMDLLGAGKATTTIVAPAIRTGSVTQYSNIHDYLLAAYAPAGTTIDVRVSGFTFDLNQQNKTTGTARLDGVFFRDVNDLGGSSAGLIACTIYNFAPTPDYEAWGMAVFGESLMQINYNEVRDYTRDGLLVYGDSGSDADPNVTIINNTVTGSASPLVGINLLYVTEGIVTENTVTGNTRSAPWAAVGILLSDSSGVTISNNDVAGNFYGIDLAFGAHDTTISGNELTDNIARGITLDDSDNNTVSGNTINGPATGTDDVAISLVNTSTGNMIGGTTADAGNTINMATSGSGNLYAIHMQSDVGTGTNTIRYNTIVGGKRSVQFDGPPGVTGTTTVSNNVISNPAWGGITAYNNGGLVISDNTLNNAVRPMEFWGPVNLTVTGNTINGSTFDGINLGSFTGMAMISGNTIHGIVDNSAIKARSAGAGLDIIGNTIYDISESAPVETPSYAGRGIQIDATADGVVIDSNVIYNVTSFAGICIDTGATGATITNNNVHHNLQGIAVNEQALEIQGNRIADNRWGIDLNGAGADYILRYNSISGNDSETDSYGLGLWAGTADAENNWWGCNEGPTTDGSTDCDIYLGTPDIDPWLVLQATIPTGNFKSGESYTVTGNMRFNSDGVDTSTLAPISYITHWLTATFTAIQGFFTPAEDNFTNGLVSSEYVPVNSGAETICVNVDNESICENRTVLYYSLLPIVTRE